MGDLTFFEALPGGAFDHKKTFARLAALAKIGELARRLVLELTYIIPHSPLLHETCLIKPGFKK